MNIAQQIEDFLLQSGGWVPAQLVCARFCVTERSLRAKGDEPGVMDGFAVSSTAGYKHVALLTVAEYLAVKHRLRWHSANQFRKTKRWDKARQRCIKTVPPVRIESQTGQVVLL